MKRSVLFALFVTSCSVENPVVTPTVVPQAEAKSPPAQPAVAPNPDIPTGDYTYGIYLNGAKVGWMRSSVTLAASEVVMRTELTAKVPGMGQVSTIVVEEERRFNAATKELTRLSFLQKAATGSVEVKGTRQGKDLALTISAGGAKQEQRVPVEENLDDALATVKLAKAAKVGATVTAKHFDPSLQKTLEVVHKVLALEDLVTGGVTTKAVKIESVYPALGVNETAWLDSAGKILESRVGGFFVARLEPPDVAQRLDYQQDLLVSAVVKPPRPLKEQAALKKLELTFTGFGSNPPPKSERQGVRVADGKVLLDLSRDPVLPNVTLPKPESLPADVREQLLPTPFIQSTDPKLVEAAKRAVDNATTTREMVERLTTFVYTHVKDEYVPAYSNALEALSSGRGDCTEHSILFVAMARALGLPSRVAVGIAYWPPGEGFGWHAWAEVFIDGRWYAVDPTWDQPQADATHVKLADGGPAEQARIVVLLGQLKIASMRE